MITKRGICLKCGCSKPSLSKGPLTSCTCGKCDLGCVYCQAGNCLYCDKEFAETAIINSDKGDEKLFTFSCGSVECESKHQSLQLFNLKSINSPIPPLGRTLLHTSVSAGDCDLTWRLLLSGANPYVADCYGLTCINLATALSRSMESKYCENYKQICRILPRGDSESDLPPQPVLHRAVTAPSISGGYWEYSLACDDETIFDVPVLMRATSVKTGDGSSRSSNREMSMNMNSLQSQRPHLSSGMAILTPLSLARVTSQSDAGVLQLLLSDNKPLGADTLDSNNLKLDDFDSLVSLVAAMGISPANDNSDQTTCKQDNVITEVKLNETVNDEDDAGMALLELMRHTSNRDYVDCKSSAKAQQFSSVECVSCYASDVVYDCPNAECNGALCER